MRQDPNSAEQPDLELSVIIPARNEERSLPTCLASLLIQSEPGFALGQQWEIIIVNDDSTDKTREIAAKAAADHEGVILLDAPPLDLSSRGGFTGKSNACWTGAQAARGSRLLFTDADTIHETNDISRALREADRHKAVLLSYSPRQIVTGFWQHAVMPLVFSELASVYPSKQVNDPVRSLAAANGQFIVVERDAYFSVGGHRAIGRDILEDVALAQNIKRAGTSSASATLRRPFPRECTRQRGDDRRLDQESRSPFPQAGRAGALADSRSPALLWTSRFGSGSLLAASPGNAWSFFCSGYVRCGASTRELLARTFRAFDVAISILGVPLFVYLLIRSVVHHRIRRMLPGRDAAYDTST